MIATHYIDLVLRSLVRQSPLNYLEEHMLRSRRLLCGARRHQDVLRALLVTQRRKQAVNGPRMVLEAGVGPLVGTKVAEAARDESSLQPANSGVLRDSRQRGHGRRVSLNHDA